MVFFRESPRILVYPCQINHRVAEGTEIFFSVCSVPVVKK